MTPRLALTGVLVVLVSGCSGGEPDGGRIEGDTLTIYSSLPLRGNSADAARDVAAGQRLAPEDAGGRVGRHRVRLVQLDSTRADTPGWDPNQVSGNAHQAVDDDTAIAYVGELDYGGSAVSLPITNDHGLLQVAPLDGLTSLTRRVPGSPREGPERYYPSQRRTFLRLVPSDLELARSLIALVATENAGRVAVVQDEGIYGRELAKLTGRLARSRGLEPAGPIEDRDEPEDVRSLAESVADERPDAVVYSGTAGATFAALLSALRRELPDTPVYGGAGLAAAGPPPAGPERVAWLQPVRPASDYPRAGRRVLRRLSDAGPAALYGYAATRLVLDAIERGGADRAAVARSALASEPRRSVLGPLRITRGDVSERRFALYSLVGGRFGFKRIVR